MQSDSQDDITWELYKQHDKKKGVADAPLTQSEQSKASTGTMEIDHGHTREYVHSVLFPMSVEAATALKNLNSKNVVQLRVDSEKETIELGKAYSATTVSAVAEQLPKDEPCFVFFQFEHQHEGQTVRPNIFIYSCPNASKVKAKMLHSTVKSAAIDAAQGQGVPVEKKVCYSTAFHLPHAHIRQDRSHRG